MVGANSTAFASDVLDIVACAYELGASESEQVAELGIGPMVNRPIRLHGQELSVLAGGIAHGGEER